MNFKGHAIGGWISSSIITGGLYCLCNYTPIKIPIKEPVYPILFFTAFFMSLFPDLDIQSIPQRWFYRFVFLLIGILIYLQKFQYASIVGFISLIPILDHHRGITHNWIFCIFLPWILVCIYVYRADGLIDPEKIMRYGWYAISCSFGWMTHLVLDSKK